MRVHARALIFSVILPGMLCGLVEPVWSSDGVGFSTKTTTSSSVTRPLDCVVSSFDFDIPAQPLNAALNQYADATGQPALFPSELVNGRNSVPVRGQYSAEAALHMLLQGSGLVAHKRDSSLGRIFILKKADNALPVARGEMAALFSEEGYPGLVQARVWQALCANALTRPGGYSSLLRFHLAADGSVGGIRLLEGSGDDRRDAALLGTLRTVRIDRPPPSAIVQLPVTMLIGPGTSAAGPQCDHTQGGR